MLKKVVSILFVGLLTNVSLAQGDDCGYTLSGIVRSTETRQAIPFATLQLPERKKSIVADANGRFVFENVCSGQFEILVKFVGFKDYRSVVALDQNDLDLEIMLETKVTDVEGVTVEGERANEIASLNTSEVSEAEIAESRGETLGSALTSITGVNVLQTGPTIAKPVVHGLHSNRILILNNGIRQEGQQWGQEHAPEIDPFVATSLSLIKGAAAVKYGSDAIGGVILVNPPDLPTEAGISGQLNAVGASNNKMYSGSGFLEGGVKGLAGFGWRLQGTYKKGGDARASDYRLSNTGLTEENFSVGIGYHKPGIGAEIYFSSFASEIGILRSAHNSSSTDFEDAIGRDQPAVINDFTYTIDHPKQVIRHELLKAFFHSEINRIGELKFLYGYQRNHREEFDIRRGSLRDLPALALTLDTHTFDLDLDVVPIGNWKSDVGLSFMSQVNDNRFDLGISPLIPNFDNYTIGGHFITRFVQPKYELEFGLRQDFKHYQIRRIDENNQVVRPEFDFSNTTGSLGFIFFLGERTLFRTNIGTAWRAPNVNELFSDGLHHGAAAIEEGNDELDSESSIKWVSNLESTGDKVDVNASVYYNVISDYIYLRPEDITLTTRGAFPVFRYTQTDATFFGFDLDLTFKLHERLNWTNSVSYLDARDTENDSPLINIPANRIRSGFEYQFTEFERVKDAYFNISALFVNRQHNAPRVVTIEQIERAKEFGFNIFSENAGAFDILDAPAGYMQIDASAGFEIPFNESTSLGVIISVDNALNVSYRDYMNRFRYYADDVGRNISLKLNLNF